MRVVSNVFRFPYQIGVALFAAIMMSTVVACGPTSNPSTERTSATVSANEPATEASSAPVELLFVQVSEDLEVDSEASTLRLVNVSPQTLYFSDRPNRIAGHLKMEEFLDEWTEKAGEDNLGADPPNATLSVYEPGNVDTTLAVVEISEPVLEGEDLLYSYKVIEGSLPAEGGATALFIDKIGVGGGVGFGYHGVGVGRRGPGV